MVKKSKVLAVFMVVVLCALQECSRIPSGILWVGMIKYGEVPTCTMNLPKVTPTIIVDRKSIAEIADAINQSNQEPVKFSPEYVFGIHYEDSTIRITASGDYFMLNGKTFHSLKHLSQILDSQISAKKDTVLIKR